MSRGISRHTYVPISQTYDPLLTGDLQPGGVKLLRDYAVSVKAGGKCNKWKEAGWAFHGGVNRHSQVAQRRMKQLRVARVTVA
jgi:hypothetical protein